jgi:hypothetical protein
MRKLVIGLLIVSLYCFPYVYFSMHQDFTNGTMLGYLLMIVVTSLLAFIGKVFSNSGSLVIGNILSVLISMYFITEMTGNDRWSGYFKPLTPYQLLIMVSFLNLIPQFFAMKIAITFYRRVNN